MATWVLRREKGSDHRDVYINVDEVRCIEHKIGDKFCRVVFTEHHYTEVEGDPTEIIPAKAAMTQFRKT